MISLKKRAPRPKVTVVDESAPTPSEQSGVLDESYESDTYVLSARNGGVSFNEILNLALAIQSECTDVMDVSFGEIEMGAENGVLYYPVPEKVESGLLTGSSRLSSYAFGQLCTKLGIPAIYARNCLKHDMTGLVAHNVNSWLKKYDDRKVIIRRYGDSIRGIVSDRYSMCDTPTILDGIKNVWKDTEFSDMSVSGYVLNPTRFHLRMVGEKLGIDDYYAGIQIDSSDVGRSTLKVQFLIYKRVCTNGLTVSKLIHPLFIQRHTGITPETFRESLLSSFDTFGENCRVARQLIINASAVKMSPNDADSRLRNSISNGARVGEEAIDRVLDIWQNTYDMSIMGLVNAITEVAQSYSLEQRLIMENYASNLMISAK